MSSWPPNKDKLYQRFWSKVLVLNNNDCWLWNASRLLAGYGNFYIGRRHYLAHRIAYVLANDMRIEDIDEWNILHNCDNPPCVNPKHLKLGKQKENIDEMKSRGRSPDQRGEKNNYAKLQSKDVSKIKELRVAGWTLRKIAEFFSIDSGHVGRICRGTRWNT